MSDEYDAERAERVRRNVERLMDGPRRERERLAWIEFAAGALASLGPDEIREGGGVDYEMLVHGRAWRADVMLAEYQARWEMDGKEPDSLKPDADVPEV